MKLKDVHCKSVCSWFKSIKSYKAQHIEWDNSFPLCYMCRKGLNSKKFFLGKKCVPFALFTSLSFFRTWLGTQKKRQRFALQLMRDESFEALWDRLQEPHPESF